MPAVYTEQWFKDNEEKIKDLFPETWTHVGNLNGLQIGFKLKLLGIDWRTNEEFSRCMTMLTKAGFAIMNGLLIRRNPNPVKFPLPT